jgi:hypothetical protein
MLKETEAATRTLQVQLQFKGVGGASHAAVRDFGLSTDSDIDAVAHTQEGLSSPEARACLFISPNKSAKLLVARQAWAEPIN